MAGRESTIAECYVAEGEVGVSGAFEISEFEITRLSCIL